MKLEFIDVRKSYGKREVLHGISFSVDSGRPLAFLGRNGAGKTTTIRILMEVFHANSGSILLDGKPIYDAHVKIGYLPEERGLYAKDKVLRQLIYFGNLRGASKGEAEESARELLAKVGLSDYVDENLGNLSKGNQQKVQICEALLNDPDILILDEPFSGLDPVNAQILMNLIKDYSGEDKIILFSSHQMNYVEDICRDIAIIQNGKIVLHGDLHDIRTEIGQGKIQLKIVDKSFDEMQDYLLKNVPSVELLEDEHDHIVVQLHDVKREELLKTLLKDGLVPEVFMNYRPSVSDVFLHYTDEEVHHHE